MADVDWREFSESGNWNIADDYARSLVLKHILLMEKYFTICQEGVEQFEDEFNIDENLMNMARLKAIRRLVNEMARLIKDTKFALKKNDKALFADYKQELKDIKDILPSLEEPIRRNGKVEKMGVSPKFLVVVNILLDMSEEILEPLNRANLIFKYSEEIDSAKLKEAMKKRMSGDD